MLIALNVQKEKNMGQLIKPTDVEADVNSHRVWVEKMWEEGISSNTRSLLFFSVLFCFFVSALFFLFSILFSFFPKTKKSTQLQSISKNVSTD